MRKIRTRQGLAAMMFAVTLAGCSSDNESGRGRRGDDAGSDGTGTDSDAGADDSGMGDGNPGLDAGSTEPDAGSDIDAGSDAATPDPRCGGHSVCEMGEALPASCSECTRRVCESDDYCCTNDWDGVCVETARKVESCHCEPAPPETPEPPMPPIDVACSADVSTIDQVPSDGACAAALACNPVTNQGCNAGEACDFNGNEGFECYASDNEHYLCEPCGIDVGGYCKAGYACVEICARYCCTDADCGTNNKCEAYLSDLGISIGLCVVAETEG